MARWIIAGAVALLIFGLLWTDLVLAVRLEEGELSLRLRYGPVDQSVYPQPDRPPRAPKAPPAKKAGRPKKGNKKAAKKPPAQPVRKQKGDLMELWQIIRSLLPPVGSILAGVRITRLRVRLVVGGADAADTAISYGRTCALVHGSFAALSGMVPLKADWVQVGWDYLHPGITEEISLELRLRLGLVVGQALRALWRLVMAIVRNSGQDGGKAAAPANHTGGITNG